MTVVGRCCLSSTVGVLVVGGIAGVEWSSLWLKKEKPRRTGCDNGVMLKLTRTICSARATFVVFCLAVFQTNVIANSSSKPIHSHPSNPCMFSIRQLMENMLKYYRTHNLFLLCVILSRGRH